MAQLSDQLLVITILAYLVAMITYAAQYAFGEHGPVARAAGREPVPAAVGAPPASGGTPAGPPGPPGPPGPLEPPGPAARREPGPGVPTGPEPAGGGRSQAALARLAQVSLLAAAALHLATAVTRGLAAGRLPWGNLYEFILATTLIGVTAWLVVLFRYPSLRHLGLYVALLNVVLLGLAGTAVYTPVGVLVPALDSAWFAIHITAATLASGVFLVGFVTAVMYLIRAGYERGRRSFLYPVGGRLPAAGAIERLTFRLHAFAFPIWTFAVAAGAIWAEAAWGRYWAWDPKEVWAFISWVVYAAYLHARATPSVKPTVAAWLAIAGWFTILMNLFGVNLFFESLHSYA